MLWTASGAWGAPGDTARIDGVCPHDGSPDDDVHDLAQWPVRGRRVHDYQVYERDRLRRRRVLVSRAAGPHGTRGEGGASFRPSVSDDGRIVAFASDAENLAPGMRHDYRHVLVRDLRRNTTTLIGGARKPKGQGAQMTRRCRPTGGFSPTTRPTSATTPRSTCATCAPTRPRWSAAPRGTRGGGQPRLRDPSMSADGRRVAFDSDATNLASRDRNHATDVFVRDLRAHTTTLVSRASGAGGATGSGDSVVPAISSDGRSVAFRFNGPQPRQRNPAAGPHPGGCRRVRTKPQRADHSAGQPGNGS